MAPSPRIERIEIGDRDVRILLTAPAEGVARRLPAANGTAERVYVDVVGTQLDPRLARSFPGRGRVRAVRTGQNDPSTARVVVELDGPTGFTLGSRGRELRLRFTATGDASREAARDVAAPAPAKQEVARPAGHLAVATVAPSPAATPPASAEPAQPGPVGAPVPYLPALPVDASASPTPLRPAAAGMPYTLVQGMRLVLPALDRAEYGDAAAAPLRDALRQWRADGTVPAVPPAQPASTGALFLSADVMMARALAGQDDTLEAIAVYERAVRTAPEFPEAPRAQLMVGLASAWLGFQPEAGSAFAMFLDRFPSDPLAPYARLGLAGALRARGRLDEAKRTLRAVRESGGADLACECRIEEARQERAAGRADAAAALFRRVATECPETVATTPSELHDRAEAIAAAGARDEARALLASPRPRTAPEEDAKLDLLQGRLALEVEDLNTARIAYERVLGRRVARATVLEAEIGLARIDVRGDAGRAAARLTALAAGDGPAAPRAELLGEAADATARSGRLDDAFGILQQAAELGPRGEREADARRAGLLGELVRTLRASEDWSGLATLYAAHTTTVRQVLDPPDRAVIADALTRLGLPAEAARLLALDATSRDAGARIAYAEAALVAGGVAEARGAVARLEPRTIDPALAPRLVRVRARIALADGDVDSAAGLAAAAPDEALDAEIAAAFVAAGDTAAAGGDWDTATARYRRVLAGPSPARARAGAAAGLVRIAFARRDGGEARVALAAATESGDPLVRRAAAALGRVSLSAALEGPDAH